MIHTDEDLLAVTSPDGKTGISFGRDSEGKLMLCAHEGDLGWIGEITLEQFEEWLAQVKEVIDERAG